MQEASSMLAMADCPPCGKTGIDVEKITVAAHVKEGCWPLGDEPYPHCDNPTCEAVHFTASGGRILRRRDVKTRVTFKENDPPRPLCYCKRVT